jgi:hypothetical protein
MVLSIDDIKTRASEQRKKNIITLAVLHQNRLRFHSEVVPSTPALASWSYRDRVSAGYKAPLLAGHEGVAQALWDFMAMVENLIPRDKFQVFKTLFRFPVITNDILAVCFDKLSRIFEGRNPAFSYQFRATEQRDDWEWYRQEKLGEPTIWSTKGWDFFKTQINSVLIVDLPQEQEGADSYPQPYFYWLPIRDVIDFEADHTTGQMEWIMFHQDDDKIAVFDDASRRVFRGKGNEVGELLFEQPHDLGYCPARFFWNEPISLDKPDIKASPVTKELEHLDWYLFYAISKRHLDTYGSYPIYWGYEQSCDYHNDETGDYCDGGFLKDKHGHWHYDNNGLLMPCPVCSQKRLVGAGSFVEIPVPDASQGQPDLSNPVGMLNVDRESLDYNCDEEKRLRNDIITSIVGTNEEITTRDALNEQQIKANFESQSTVLQRVKKGFEEAQKWVDDTCCRERYGTSFLSSSVSYGTEFYLFSSDELRERYKTAKETGMSEADLDALLQQIIETEYRHNPQQMQRMIILADLEPYRHLTRNEVQGLYDKGIIDMEELLVKINFADFIRRFERENMNIIEFGANIEYPTKIQTIKEVLRQYATEALPKNPKEQIIKVE